MIKRRHLFAFIASVALTGFSFSNLAHAQNSLPEVTLETSMGNIVIEIDKNNAPVTSDNFLEYVNAGYYDGTIFHRVIDNFMIQGGGFTTDMQQKSTRAPIKLEKSPALPNTRGSVAMARTNNPDSATSQFFINVVNNPMLNGSSSNDGYAVFGHVVSGMDVVDKIRAVQTKSVGAYNDVPVTPVVINKACLTRQ